MDEGVYVRQAHEIRDQEHQEDDKDRAYDRADAPFARGKFIQSASYLLNFTVGQTGHTTRGLLWIDTQQNQLPLDALTQEKALDPFPVAAWIRVFENLICRDHLGLSQSDRGNIHHHQDGHSSGH